MEYQQSYTYKIFVYCMITMLVLPSLLAQPAMASSPTPYPEDYLPVPPKERPELGLNNPYEPTTAVPFADPALFTNANGAFLHSPDHTPVENHPSNTPGWWQQRWQSVWKGVYDRWFAPDSENESSLAMKLSQLTTHYKPFYLKDVQPVKPVWVPSLNEFTVYLPVIYKPSTLISAEYGGTLTDGTFSIIFHPDGLPESILVNLRNDSSSDLPDNFDLMGPKVEIRGHWLSNSQAVVALDPEAHPIIPPGAAKPQPVSSLYWATITITLTENQTNPEQLAIARQDQLTNKWEILPTQWDQQAGILTTNTEHLGRFAVIRNSAFWNSEVLRGLEANELVIVDELDSGFQHFNQAGNNDSWWHSNCGPGGCWENHAFWTYNRSPFNPGDPSIPWDWATWTPSLSGPDTCSVQVWIPGDHATTTGAAYEIHHAGQIDTVVVDQSAISGRWENLGSYDFLADGTEHVYLDDVVPETGIGESFIGFDAVMFACGNAQLPPTVEIIQLYGTGMSINGRLSVTLLARITAGSLPISNQSVTISNGTVTQPLIPYPSSYHGPNIYAAVFENVPENTSITFEVAASDNAGNTITDTVQGYFTDGKFIGYGTCLGYNDLGYTLVCGNPINTIGGQKIETFPLIYLPGPGEADIQLALTYNSNSIRPSIFGMAMSSDLETKIVELYNPLVNGVEVVISDGGRFRFVDNGDGTFTAVSQGNEDTLIKDGDGYLYTTRTQVSYRFDENGRLLQKIFRDGNTITYTYTGDQLTSLTTGGRTVTLGYNADGYVETISYADKVVTLVYNGDILTEIHDAMDGSWLLEYEIREIGEIVDERGEEYAYEAANYLLTRVTTPEGRIKNEQTYNDQMRVDTQISSSQGVLDFSYMVHPDGRRETHMADAYGVEEIHYYNALGQLEQVTNREGDSEYYFYDAEFHLERKIDFNGFQWEYVRDDNGNIIELLGPEGLHEIWEYNDFNFPTYYQDGDGYEWHWEYDNHGNLTGIIQPLPDGVTMTLVYNSQGLPTDIYDFSGNHIRHEYDLVTGDLLRTWDGEGALTQYVYDEYGRLLHKFMPEGGVWTFTYDLNDNLTAVAGPHNYHATFTYDKDSLLLHEVDADTYPTTYRYDKFGRLEEVRNGEDEPIWFRYGEMNELLEVENGRHATTFYTYDHNYRVTQIDMPEDVTWTFEYDALGNLLFFTDGEGRVTATTYDGLSRARALVQNYIEGGPINADTNVVTTFDYDDRRNVTSSVNALKGETEFGFDSVGFMEWSENEENERTTYDYDGNGNLTLVHYPEGNEIEMAYNGRNQLKLLRDGEHFETEYHYDGNGNLTDVLAPDLIRLHHEYNQLDQRTFSTANFVEDGGIGSDLNVTTSYTYSKVGDLLSVTDAEGYFFEFEYDKAHRLTQEINPEGDIEYVYDEVGNLIRMVDANENPWNYTYDLRDRLTLATNPELHSVGYAYDHADNLTAVTDANGNITTTDYDALNRPILFTAPAPLNYETHLAYNALGSLLSLTDGNDHTTHFEYDAAQRTTARIDAEGNRMEYEYDENGRLTLQRIPFPNPAQTIEEQFTYDGRNLLTSLTNGEGETTAYGYNSVGLLQTKTENDGIITHYSYDALRRLNSVTLNYLEGQPAIDDQNVSYHYLYDRVGNLVSIVDPLNHETVFAYNGLGSLEYERNPLDSEWFYDYDPAQNLTFRQDANGETTHYSYYADHQLHVIDYQDDPSVTYTYDPNNNPLTMQDGLGTTTWNYDEINRLTSVTDSLGRTIAYEYDAVNRRAITYPDTLTVVYTYFDNNWMETATDPVGGTSTYAYDPAGRTTNVDHPNSTSSLRTYDRANRLTFLGNYQDGGDVLSEFSYLYDAAGQRVQATNTYGWRNPPTVVENYTYDGLRRLTAVTDDDGLEMSYEYDRAGNRTLWQTNDDPFGQSPQDGFTATYSYNAANQLTTAQIERTPPAQSESITYSYDANGNRIDRLIEGNGSDAGTAYSYDDENRLVSVYNYLATGGGNINWQDETTMAYDGNGRRLVETYDPHAGGGGLKRTEYTFDGLDPIAEYDLWNNHQRNYYRGAGNELIQLHHFPSGSQGQQYWYHHNGHGDIAGLTKHDGQSTHNYRYDAYGGVTPDNGNWTSPHNDYTLTEKAYDDHTGLHYFGARYYDSRTAVWITQDTYRGNFTLPTTLHRYGYLSGNPINFIDWYGWKQFSKNEIVDAEFNTQVQITFEKLEDNPPGFWGLFKSYNLNRYLDADTSFWNGSYPDETVCLKNISDAKNGCYKQSEINYIYQGMWGAAAGETLEETQGIVTWYKDKMYGHKPSEGVKYWTEYGYYKYIKLKQIKEGICKPDNLPSKQESEDTLPRLSFMD